MGMYVYTITSIEKYDGEHLIYVGSCVCYDTRMRKHRETCANPNHKSYDVKLYRFIRQYGWDAFKCEIIEKLHTDISENDLLIREQFYIDLHDSTKSMNMNNAIIIGDKLEHRRKIQKVHRQKNLDRIRAIEAEYRNLNRDKIVEESREYRASHKTEFSEWRDTNRDRVREINRRSERKRLLWKNAIKDLNRIAESIFM